MIVLDLIWLLIKISLIVLTPLYIWNTLMYDNLSWFDVFKKIALNEPKETRVKK